eukprot:Lithocolla_globosa_v1_NODE_349_length_4370_cov_18.560371.p3 type:complete len:151 gc:universal NODE_349_length_4370_cov_18.560371:2325-2777(+)
MNNAKKTWGILKNILNPKRNSQSFPKQININQQDGVKTELTDKKDIADAFNSFFTTVAANLVKKINKPQRLYDRGKKFTDYVTPNRSSCFRFQSTNSKQVEKLLCKLDDTKAIGMDYLHTTTIVDAADLLAPMISHIFNLCVNVAFFQVN